LTWWAVRRVSKFSGRINLWLAGGFALLYGSYTIFRDNWPDWLGRAVFTIFDNMGGIPALTTALVILAAVPAAFQYGLWDSNASDRCRRLELLLPTALDGTCYWHASTGAAWARGRGYFLTALLLWGAGLVAGIMSWQQVLASVAAGVILWGLYFALGFWSFSRGMHAGALGLGLTLGLPLGTWLLVKAGWQQWMALLPPGSTYVPTQGGISLLWGLGPLLGGAAALGLARWSIAHCEQRLKRSYEMHHGGTT
jgi:hypothetical protein